MRWCILRTSGQQTLPLAKSLAAAGFNVWTPVKTIAVAKTKRKPRTEREVPILPTFVFADAAALSALAYAAADPVSPHPGFSIFRHDGRIPIIGAAAVAGLRDAERAEAARIEGEREEITREARRQERIGAMRTEQARRKALRSERREFAPGASVDVAEMPALSGLTGVVVQANGTSALVSFGGALVMTIEAWRLSPHDVDRPPA